MIKKLSLRLDNVLGAEHTPYNTKNGPFFDPNLGPAFCHGLSGVVDIIGWRGPYYMYIYSLRAFLTTKGALIDGD